MIRFEFINNHPEYSLILKSDEFSRLYNLSLDDIKMLYDDIFKCLRENKETSTCKHTKSPHRFVLILDRDGIYINRDILAKILNELQTIIRST